MGSEVSSLKHTAFHVDLGAEHRVLKRRMSTLNILLWNQALAMVMDCLLKAGGRGLQGLLGMDDTATFRSPGTQALPRSLFFLPSG